MSSLSKLLTSDLNLHQTKLLEFNSVTCSSSNKNRFNSATISTTILERSHNLSIVLHNILTQTKYTLVPDIMPWHDLGINNMLLISGDKYVYNRKRDDSSNSYIIKMVLREGNVFNIGASYPDSHVLCSSSFQDLFIVLLNRKGGCSAYITQIFNHMDNLLRNNLRCSILKLGSLLPGLFISSKHPLAVDINLKCGIYLTRQAKELLECGWLDGRATFLLYIYRTIEIVENNTTWIQIFTLNKTRPIKVIIWILNDLVYYMKYWRIKNYTDCYKTISNRHNAYNKLLYKYIQH
ncbi:5,10-methylenetetrahydrofolate reductase [Candidatus Hodgkinia cicadicola]|uniref:Methylenetetrahydrofolate reductase n=1 Tax=Candidatus Hodgkinia cicadicola TaxID=573658 RepID=A0ABX4MG08_9HYPH|nr:5,10-methylenetetrahydrofolate reductase [Candidatus Hodgkinia cicadicola]